MAGLLLATFRTQFSNFSTVADALISNFISMINNGYCFTQQNVTDTNILEPYYYLLAHFVAVSTQPITGGAAGASGSFMPISATTGLGSLSFQQLNAYSADQSFMLSTWYGQTFYYFQKQQYIQAYYMNW